MRKNQQLGVQVILKKQHELNIHELTCFIQGMAELSENEATKQKAKQMLTHPLFKKYDESSLLPSYMGYPRPETMSLTIALHSLEQKGYDITPDKFEFLLIAIRDNARNDDVYQVLRDIVPHNESC